MSKDVEIEDRAQGYIDACAFLDLEYANCDIVAQEFREVYERRSVELLGAFHVDTLRVTTKMGAQILHTTGVLVSMGPSIVHRRNKFRQVIDDESAGLAEAEEIIAKKGK